MIYADCAAQRPPREEAVQAVMEAIRSFGNPSGVHDVSSRASAMLFDARKKVAEALNAEKTEIIFTASGTEADNTAVFSAARNGAEKGRNKLIVSSVEHSAVLNAAREAQKLFGCTVELIPCSKDGTADMEALAKMADDRTAMVSLMTANNETGVIQPAREASAIAKSCGALFHTDAVQAAGSIPVNVRDIGCDMLSLSSHKFGGIAGAGALFCRENLDLFPLLYGGGQERGRRAGTQAVPAIYAMGKALEAACSAMDEESAYTAKLRDGLEELLDIPGAVKAGSAAKRLPGTACVCFPGRDGEELALRLNRLGVCVSSGAACSAGSSEASHVLDAMGISSETSKGALRFSLCSVNTEEEIYEIAEKVKKVLA